MNIIFSEASGVAESNFGKCQAPIRMFLEKRGEAFEQKSLLKELFNMETSKTFGVTRTSMTAMKGFEPVGENGAYPMDGFQEGHKKMVWWETWKDQFSISWEAGDDSVIMDLKKPPLTFLQSYYRTREQFGAQFYADAMQGKTSFQINGRTFDLTCCDGMPLFYTAHPPKVSGDKQCNMFSDAFSVDALSRMETAMHEFRGDNNEILDVAPTTILIPDNTDLKKKVFEAIGSDRDPTTSNNAFNYQYGRWNVIIWPYLNSFLPKNAMPWVLLDPEYNRTYGGANWTDRVKLEMRSTLDENTDANVWRGRSRFNADFFDWRFAAVGGITGGQSLAG